jgi:hypothetical protein
MWKPYTKILAKPILIASVCYIVTENNKDCEVLCRIKTREWNMCEGPALLSVTLLT